MKYINAMYIWIDFDEMNLYSWVFLWFKNAVVTTRIARVRTIYLIE